jgi:hypothetical protein
MLLMYHYSISSKKDKQINRVLQTSVAEFIACRILSKTPVFATSNDLECRRYWYIRRAATGLLPENPRCWVMYLSNNF